VENTFTGQGRRSLGLFTFCIETSVALQKELLREYRNNLRIHTISYFNRHDIAANSYGVADAGSASCVCIWLTVPCYRSTYDRESQGLWVTTSCLEPVVELMNMATRLLPRS
jgi:hypothetical protein